MKQRPVVWSTLSQFREKPSQPHEKPTEPTLKSTWKTRSFHHFSQTKHDHWLRELQSKTSKTKQLHVFFIIHEEQHQIPSSPNKSRKKMRSFAPLRCSQTTDPNQLNIGSSRFLLQSSTGTVAGEYGGGGGGGEWRRGRTSGGERLWDLAWTYFDK